MADSVTPGLVDKQVSIFHECGLSPANVQDAHDPWALQTLVAAGIGVSLHTREVANTFEPPRPRT